MGFEEAIDILIYGQLSTDTAITDIVKGVYDYVPQSDRGEIQADAFPFVSIGEPLYEMDDSFDENMYSGQITIHVWSRHKSRLQCSQIKDLVYNRLHRSNAAMETGFNLVLLHCANSVTDLHPDGITRQGTMTFNILVEG